MAKVFKSIPQQVAALKLANKNHWTDNNLSDSLYRSLRLGGEKEYPNDHLNNEENVRKFAVQKLLDLYDLDEDYARILVDGAFSRPQTQGKLDQGKSYGIFESTPLRLEDQGSAIEKANQLLKSNPDKWGVLYGYRANKGLHRLKNPIFVNSSKDIEKYQNAIGRVGKGMHEVEMQGTYKKEGE